MSIFDLANIAIPKHLGSIEVAIGDRNKNDILDITVDVESFGQCLLHFTGDIIPEKVDGFFDEVAAHLPFDVAIPADILSMTLKVGDANANGKADVTIGFEVLDGPGLKVTQDIDYATAMKVFGQVVSAVSELKK